jgi:hypothetical protein
MSDLMRLARAAAGRRSSTEPEATVTERPHTAVNDPALPTGACATCAHYRAKSGQAPDGWCTKYRTETWGAYANGCANDWQPAEPDARTLERRRAAVIARLEADPALRYGFDVRGATPNAPADGPVSVMLGLRTTDGAIVTGELRLPADRWPGMALFTAYWRQAAEARPS